MDTALINALLTGGGAAVSVLGAFIILFVTGRICPKSVVDDKNAEITELKATVAAERARADAAVTAASAAKDVLSAIQFGRNLGPARDAP